MPTIAVNLGDVQEFTSLDVGTYYAEIEKVVLKEATEKGKFDQLRCQYLVIDGDATGRRQSEFRSFSPNAMGFMKGWFKKFGLGEIPDLDFDDDTLEMMAPDLVGSKVIFEVVEDPKAPGGLRTSLVSVEEFGPGVPEGDAPTEAAKPAARPAARPAVTRSTPEPESEEAEDEAEEAAPEPEAEEPKRVAPRRPAATPASAAKPVRRTLR